MYKLCINSDNTLTLVFIKDGLDVDDMEHLEGANLVDIDATDAENLGMIEQYYWSGETHEYVQDTDWTHNVMPIWLIKQKELAYQNNLLAAELAETTPDPVVVAQLQVQIATDTLETDPIVWYTRAQANLDPNTGRAELEKPIIDAKLEDLIG